MGMWSGLLVEIGEMHVVHAVEFEERSELVVAMAREHPVAHLLLLLPGRHGWMDREPFAEVRGGKSGFNFPESGEEGSE